MFMARRRLDGWAASAAPRGRTRTLAGSARRGGKDQAGAPKRRGPARVLVDGYNLAARFGSLKERPSREEWRKSPQAHFQAGKLEKARAKLDEELTHFAQARGVAVLVAYDALNNASAPTAEDDVSVDAWLAGDAKVGLQVAFVRDNSADGFIEQACAFAAEMDGVAVRVVTNDSAEATVARGFGADVQSCESFILECRNLRSSSAALVRDAAKTAQRAEGRRAGRLAGQLDAATLDVLEQLRRGG